MSRAFSNVAVSLSLYSFAVSSESSSADKVVRELSVYSVEVNILILLLKQCDEWAVDGLCHDQRVHALSLEHIDVLALLYFRTDT